MREKGDYPRTLITRSSFCRFGALLLVFSLIGGLSLLSASAAEGVGGRDHDHDHDHEHDHEHDHDHGEKGRVAAHPDEFIHSLELDYHLGRDGFVTFEQRFRLGVAGAAIKRGPILNYLTAFRGPAGLTLDKEIEILEIFRDGKPESFHLRRKSGFTTLLIGSSDRELEKRAHDYVVRGRMKADWSKRGGEFSTLVDAVGALPRLPIRSASATILLPEGVEPSHFTPALSGVVLPAGKGGAAYHYEQVENRLHVRSAGPMGGDRIFLVNFSWPSEGFAIKGQWMSVLSQHPRLPLSVLSAIPLAWVLVLLLKRASTRPI